MNLLFIFFILETIVTLTTGDGLVSAPSGLPTSEETSLQHEGITKIPNNSTTTVPTPGKETPQSKENTIVPTIKPTVASINTGSDTTKTGDITTDSTKNNVLPREPSAPPSGLPTSGETSLQPKGNTKIPNKSTTIVPSPGKEMPQSKENTIVSTIKPTVASINKGSDTTETGDITTDSTKNNVLPREPSAPPSGLPTSGETSLQPKGNTKIPNKSTTIVPSPGKETPQSKENTIVSTIKPTVASINTGSDTTETGDITTDSTKNNVLPRQPSAPPSGLPTSGETSLQPKGNTKIPNKSTTIVPSPGKEMPQSKENTIAPTTKTPTVNSTNTESDTTEAGAIAKNSITSKEEPSAPSGLPTSGETSLQHEGITKIPNNSATIVPTQGKETPQSKENTIVPTIKPTVASINTVSDTTETGDITTDSTKNNVLRREPSVPPSGLPTSGETSLQPNGNTKIPNKATTIAPSSGKKMPQSKENTIAPTTKTPTVNSRNTESDHTEARAIIDIHTYMSRLVSEPSARSGFPTLGKTSLQHERITKIPNNSATIVPTQGKETPQNKENTIAPTIKPTVASINTETDTIETGDITTNSIKNNVLPKEPSAPPSGLPTSGETSLQPKGNTKIPNKSTTIVPSPEKEMPQSKENTIVPTTKTVNSTNTESDITEAGAIIKNSTSSKKSPPNQETSSSSTSRAIGIFLGCVAVAGLIILAWKFIIPRYILKTYDVSRANNVEMGTTQRQSIRKSFHE